MNNRLRHLLNKHKEVRWDIDQIEEWYDSLSDTDKEEVIKMWDKVFAETSGKNWWVVKEIKNVWKDPKVTVRENQKRSLWKKTKQSILLGRIWLDKKTRGVLGRVSFRLASWLGSIPIDNVPTYYFKTEGRFAKPSYHIDFKKKRRDPFNVPVPPPRSNLPPDALRERIEMLMRTGMDR